MWRFASHTPEIPKYLFLRVVCILVLHFCCILFGIFFRESISKWIRNLKSCLDHHLAFPQKSKLWIEGKPGWTPIQLMHEFMVELMPKKRRKKMQQKYTKMQKTLIPKCKKMQNNAKNSRFFLNYWGSLPIGSMYDIFTYIYHKNPLNVGKYTSPMDPMGYNGLIIVIITLPKTNSSPLNIGLPKRKGSSSNHQFSGA